MSNTQTKGMFDLGVVNAKLYKDRGVLLFADVIIWFVVLFDCNLWEVSCVQDRKGHRLV